MSRLCYMGIPMGLQYSVTAIGTLVVQAAINGFGSMVVAGVTAAQKINNFFGCPMEALGGTMAAFAGQNMGAGRLDRIGKGLKGRGALRLCGLCFCCCLRRFFTGRQLSMLFLDEPDPQVIEYSYQFLVTSAGGYCLLTLVDVVRFTIQGMGFSVFCHYLRRPLRWRPVLWPGWCWYLWQATPESASPM